MTRINRNVVMLWVAFCILGAVLGGFFVGAVWGTEPDTPEGTMIKYYITDSDRKTYEVAIAEDPAIVKDMNTDPGSWSWMYLWYDANRETIIGFHWVAKEPDPEYPMLNDVCGVLYIHPDDVDLWWSENWAGARIVNVLTSACSTFDADLQRQIEESK